MSALGLAAADYLAVRRGVGYKLEAAGRVLPRFVAFLDDRGAETVTVALALEFATDAGRDVAGRLQIIRGFARYLRALDPTHEVPPAGLVPDPVRRAVPHLYSEDDIAAVISAARRLAPPLRAATTATVFGLLAVTGMRVGEALALNDTDIDRPNAALTVWLAKLNKSRLVPVATSTIDALDDYQRTRRRLVAAAGPAVFVGNDGQRLSYSAFKAAFDRAVDDVGLRTTTGRRPRAHDLRHAFAVRTLLGWYRTGGDVQALLPRLSTYLGHVDPAATYWYLSAAPELMALAAQRLEPRDGSR